VKVLTCKIDDEMLYLLDVFAMKHHFSRSEAVRLAISMLLKDDVGAGKELKGRVERIQL
jgi:metal-responsive CopG/Arc/MetJ family transcriptional regulator